MTKANAVLVLLDTLLKRRAGAPVRVPDLYHYSQLALLREASAELAEHLRELDASTFFVLLEELRSEGYLTASGNAFDLTPEGRARIKELEESHPEAVTDKLRDTAAVVA
jgi:hypothetical protein